MGQVKKGFTEGVKKINITKHHVKNNDTCIK
jgi:hypothetical protein